MSDFDHLSLPLRRLDRFLHRISEEAGEDESAHIGTTCLLSARFVLCGIAHDETV